MFESLSIISDESLSPQMFKKRFDMLMKNASL